MNWAADHNAKMDAKIKKEELERMTNRTQARRITVDDDGNPVGGSAVGMSDATAEKYSKPQPFNGVIARFPRAILAVAAVSVDGTKKHQVPLDDVSYRDLPDAKNLYGEALCRHLLREAIEGPVDPEFDHLHAAHAAWDALARLEVLLIDMEKKEG